MKIRNGFVSNSSSTCFLIIGWEIGLNNLDENWIKPSIWNREHQFQWWDKNGKSHWYTPDFWSPKLQKYFEIKGFWKKDDVEKKEFVQTLKNVEIVYKEDLELYKLNNNLFNLNFIFINSSSFLRKISIFLELFLINIYISDFFFITTCIYIQRF